jgi:hypothetical protein
MNVLGEMFLERGLFRRFHGRLSGDNRADLSGYGIRRMTNGQTG